MAPSRLGAVDTLRPDVPSPLSELCRRCLSKNREDRPSGMEQVRDMLQRALSTEAATPAPSIPRRVAWKAIVVIGVPVLAILTWVVFNGSSMHIKKSDIPFIDPAGHPYTAVYSDRITVIKANAAAVKEIVSSEERKVKDIIFFKEEHSLFRKVQGISCEVYLLIICLNLCKIRIYCYIQSELVCYTVFGIKSSQNAATTIIHTAFCLRIANSLHVATNKRCLLTY